MTLAFDNLPLFEVAVRFTLDPPFPASIQLFYDFATELKRTSGFEVIGNPPLEIPPGTSRIDGSLGSFTGARFLSSAGTQSITFNPSLIGARWHGGHTSKTYVGYGKLKADLFNVVDILEKMLGERPSIRVVNMFHSNFISCTDRSQLPHWLNVELFPQFLELSKMNRIEFSWAEPDADLRLELQRGQGGEETQEGYSLTCAAGCYRGPQEGSENAGLEEPAEILDRLHNYLCLNFVRMITDHAKKEWKLRGQ